MSNSKNSSQYEAADCFRVSKRKKSQKKLREKFAESEKSCKFAVPFRKNGTEIEIWCNGSTTDSGSVSEGSNPSIST